MPATAIVVLALLGLGAVYAFLVRPWHLRMGSTPEEVARPLPGDGLVPHPRFMWNQAVTVRAPAAQVWPWLVQIGNGRAGWYSWDIIHRLLRSAGSVDSEHHSAERIIPELQVLQLGDPIRMAPESTGLPAYTVLSIDPQRALVTAIQDELNPVSWVWVLEPIDEHTTRLIVRYRQDWQPKLMNTLMFFIANELGSLVMQPKTLAGIKRRAEAAAG